MATALVSLTGSQTSRYSASPRAYASIVRGADPVGIDVEVVRRDPEVAGAGFKVLPRRWVVECTFGWFMLHRRRLTCGYETREESSRAMIHWSMIGIMGRALTGNSAPTWQELRPM